MPSKKKPAKKRPPKLTEVPVRAEPASRAPAKNGEAEAAPDLSHISESLRPLAVRCDSLEFDPKNVKDHPDGNVDALRASLKVYGQRRPIVVNKRTGIVEAGNCLLAAALSLGYEWIAASFEDDDDATARGYSLVDNRSGELGTWNTANLALAEEDLFVGADAVLDQMVADLNKEVGLFQPAAEPGEGGDDFDTDAALAGECRVKAGELWLIDGGHRLLCADSTDPEAVARLMDGEKADLCFTSPPYAQQRDYTTGPVDWDVLMQGVFTNLPMADSGQVLVNLGLIHKDGEWWPYWDGWIEWMREQGWRRFGWYVWDKLAGMPGDWNGRLAPAFEFIFHFNKTPVHPTKAAECKDAGRVVAGRTRGVDGKLRIHTATKNGDPVQSHKIHDNVIRCGPTKGMNNQHPATMPVALSLAIIESWPGDVYDPFAGSGTTMIAAARLERKSFLMEIEPRYCEVILRRCEAEGLAVSLAESPP